MKRKRIIYAALAGVVALSLIVGAVFAWVDNSQHKTNVLTGGPDEIVQDVRLIEDFEEPDDWKEGDLVDKKISVKNTGEGEIFVRIQLKEYMEVALQTYSYAADAQGNELFLLVDASGTFVASAGTGAAHRASFRLALENMGLTFTESQIVGPFTAYGTTTPRYYLRTDGTTNLFGKNGARLLTNFVQGPFESFDSTVTRGTYQNTVDHRLHPTAECLYTIHTWDKADHLDCENADRGKFHDYVKWNLGDVILMSEWDGLPVAKWILDDISDATDQGWAYWGQALLPGVQTGYLMQSLELIKQPAGPFYYALHVDMQAADIYQLRSNFTGMPQKIENVYRPIQGFSISANTATARGDDVVVFQAFWNGAPIALSSVNWSVARKDGAANPFPNTRFNDVATGAPSPGRLNIGTLQDATVLVVTATYTPPGGTLQTRTFEITTLV